VCWKLCSSCWSLHLHREEFLSAPIHSPPLCFTVSVLQRSARSRRIVQKYDPNNQYCTSKYGRSVANPRTVRPARTVRQPGADSPTNLLQLKTPNSTDRDKPTHELATNMTTTDYWAPRGEFADQAWTVRQVRIEQLEFENASMSSPIHLLISQTT
jgi:hypothetical protein